MVRQTQLHDFDVPETGDNNYDVTFDAYFNEVDNVIEIRDIEANLSTYTPISGAKFVATDTENVYFGDGSNWNQANTFGPDPSFDSASIDEASIQNLGSSVDAQNNDLNNVGALDAASISAEGAEINGEYLWASSFNGTDADARLDNALSAASNGDTIYLENATYSTNRTIGKIILLVGTGQQFGGTTVDGADWTLSGPASLRDIDFINVPTALTHDGGFADLTHIKGAPIQINADGVLVESCWSVSVTYASGTERGTADSLFGNSTVTDNGTNTTGTIG